MSDYVVRPKRRRTGAPIVQAVDPCLGYYVPLVNDGRSRTGEKVYPPHTYIDDCNGKKDADPAAKIGRSMQADDGQPQLQPRRSSSPTSSSSELRNAEWSTFVPVIPPYDPLHVSPPRRHEEALGVEDFLKRSSRRRTYAGRRRVHREQHGLQTKSLSGQDSNYPVVQTEMEEEEGEDVVHLRSRTVIRKIITSDPSSEMEMETSSISFDPPTPLSEKIKKKRSRPKQKKSLKERIYEAAVATYGDPDPTFMHPELQGIVDGSMPLPLRFVPGPEVTRPREVVEQKKRNWTLVDPRRSMAIRTTTFSSRIRPPNLVFNNESLRGEKTSVDTYRFTQLGAPSLKTIDRQSLGKGATNKIEKATSAGLAPRAIVCAPLTFVSIHEAEDSYASLHSHSGRGVQANQKMKSGSPSALLMARLQGGNPHD